MSTPASKRRQYGLLGFFAGLLFPLTGFIIIEVFNSSDIILLTIISFAPFILMIFAMNLGRQTDLVQAASNQLENQVELRTRSIRNMLDISGQAVFSFDEEFKVMPEYSSFCMEFFSEDIRGKDVRDLMFESLTEKEEFSHGIELLFAGKASPDVVFDLLEPELNIGGRDSQIVYRFIRPDRVLVGITDISGSREMTRQILDEELSKEMIFTAVSHQSYFRDLLREAEDVFFQMDNIIANDIQDELRLRKLLNSLHTFRGNLSFFHFENTHLVADDLENYMGDMLSLEEPVDIQAAGLSLKRIYFQELRKIVDTLGEDWIQGVDSIQVPRRQFQQLMRYVSEQHGSDKQLLSSLSNFYKTPLRNLFTQYPHMAENLAARLGKSIGDIYIEGGEFSVNPDRFRQFSTSAVHLLRNMIDHGIELPITREEHGKAREGRLRIQLYREDRNICFRFSDDGKGIDFAGIAAKARQMGLIGLDDEPSKSQLLKYIFSSGFSTSDSFSGFSGKGLGLAAVKAEVKNLGGTIAVQSKNGEGTTFTIQIPNEDES